MDFHTAIIHDVFTGQENADGSILTLRFVLTMHFPDQGML